MRTCALPNFLHAAEGKPRVPLPAVATVAGQGRVAGSMQNGHRRRRPGHSRTRRNAPPKIEQFFTFSTIFLKSFWQCSNSCNNAQTWQAGGRYAVSACFARLFGQLRPGFAPAELQPVAATVLGGRASQLGLDPHGQAGSSGVGWPCCRVRRTASSVRARADGGAAPRLGAAR